MNIPEILNSIKASFKANRDIRTCYDYIAMIREGTKNPKTLKTAIAHGRWLSDYLDRLIPRMVDINLMRSFFTAHEELLYDLAPYDFDSYCLYLEWDRAPEQKFYAPRRKQLRPLAIQLQRLYDDELDLLCISLPPGIGKALSNDTPVLTRKGWKRHGDLVVGDEVIGKDGKFKRVTYVHPKCMLDVEIEFTNGEKIQCHENHVWEFFDRTRGRVVQAETKDFEQGVIETGEPGHRGHRYMLQVPHCECVTGEHKELPLDPYVLGVWLGDGTTTNPYITSPVCDRPIIDKIIAAGYPVSWQTQHKTTGVMTYGFGFRKELRSMGMCHSRKNLPKHIPDEYFTASKTQRLELLAGLIDTDGTKKYDGRFSYSTTSERLKDDIVRLISTFGWRTTVSSCEPKVSSSGIHGRKTVYVISFNVDCVIPCALERKRNTVTNRQNRAISVKSITRVEPKEGNCITVEGDGMYRVGNTLIPTHNSTIAFFFLTWWGGNVPDKGILTVSHNASFIKGAYEQILKIVGKDSEYRFLKVFPNSPVVNTDAKNYMIDLENEQRFATFQFSTIGAGNAGRVRAQSLLYCDDLISGMEVALSEDRLQSLWSTYTGDLLQRKIGRCKELHISTRWSLRDICGRLQERYGDDDRAEFIEVDCYDADGNSNFDYPYNLGYTTEALHRLEQDMDEATFSALYRNRPIEREGQLYADDELRRYFELPDGEPDAIIAVCDTKDKGKDFEFMPVAYQYGNDYYLEDCVCNDGKPEIVEAMLVNLLIAHKVQMCQFESNSAGGRIAEKIQSAVKERGGRTKITTKYTTANKETKIIVNSPWVKEHVLFKDKSVIGNNREYKRMMSFLTSYTLKGKNAHDDVPDGMAMLALYAQSLVNKNIEVFKRPF